MFKKILLPTDSSDHSMRATERAIALAKMFKGEIDILYVIDGKTSKSDVLHHVNKIEIENNRKGKMVPVEEKISQAGVKYSTKFLHGEPGPTIIEHANKEAYDCVVIGSRGLNNLQTMVLGSVSHKVAKRVESPVLIVK